MIASKKVVVVLPAYNAAKTLEKTCSEIPRDIVDEVILVDDHSRDDTAAVLGLSSAIGAVGGYLIPRSFGASMKATGSPSAALSWFLVYYLASIVITWWYYRRRTFLAKQLPGLADANA